MKKVLSIVLTICLMLTTTPLSVFNLTANALTSGYYTYEVSNGKATITGCDISISGDITIPDTLDVYPVTSIGDRAFYYCSNLISITLPDGVTSIGDYAFYYCSKLTSVNIPDSVTSIGSSAFWNCSSLLKITISDSLTSIGDSAFYNCDSLTSVNIPDSVTSIGASAFSSCSNLTSITVDENNTEYCSMDDVLFNKNKTELICYPASKTGFKYTIPDSVTSIGASAFEGCSTLISIILPDSVTSIGANAFYGCSNLSKITIPDGVTSIGNYAFYNCTSLTSINIPKGVTSIGNDNISSSVFSGCSSLTSITIPDSVTFIGQFTFLNCSSLKNVYITDIAKWWEIDFSGSYSNPLYYGAKLYLNNELVTNLTIPDGVTSIGGSAFDGCSSLTSITIPDSVTSISIDAFEDCSSLTSIDVSLENTVYSSVDGVLFNKNKTELLRYPVGKTATAYTIPDSVTSIGDNAFSYCRSLTSITILDSVTSIGSSAFEYCSGLTSITIPESVTSIGGRAFYGCSNLTSIVISEGIIVIEESTFSGCYNLKEIFLPKGLQLIKKYNFGSCSNLTDVYYGGIQEEWANITILQNNNYLNTANIHCYDSISVNGKEENVQWDDENKPILPKGYTDEQNKHFAIIGWTDKDGNKVDTSTLTVDNMVPLTAVVAEIPVAPTMLEADLIPTNDPYLPTGNKYVNGFYVQGTQIRIPSDDENIKMGLRFVNILDNNLLSALKEGATDISYGTLVMLKKYHDGTEVTLDTQNAAKVEGTNTFKHASEFNNQYLKYTVAITGITEEYFTEKFIVRPYITFTYNGEVVTLYGEQYEGASLYSAAKLAVAPDSIEDQNAKSWIQENIVNVVEKIGDNDVPSDDVFA